MYFGDVKRRHRWLRSAGPDNADWLACRTLADLRQKSASIIDSSELRIDDPWMHPRKVDQVSNVFAFLGTIRV